MKRRTTIILETRRFLVSKTSNEYLSARCDQCDREVKMALPGVAAATCGRNERVIYRWIEGGHVHFFEDEIGAVWVCLDSLPTE